MKYIFIIIHILFLSTISLAQNFDSKWYSEDEQDGLIIQNSFPKGGPYTVTTHKHFNYSYLVFYSRVVNTTAQAISIELNFSADSVAIPNSPNTFMKVFLPTKLMTADKHNAFSYGITELASFDQPTSLHRTIPPNGESLFYTVAVFYQTKDEKFDSNRGGNRAEYVFDEKKMVFNLLPQMEAMPCGEFKIVK